MKWLYLLLIAAATADVVTRALVPAEVADLSPWVNAVGYGWGFLALKTALVVGVIGVSELTRRVRGAEVFAGFWPVLLTVAYTFGAWTNVVAL